MKERILMVRTQGHLPSNEPVVPDTMAGRWLATYLATFNTGDSAALRSLMTTTLRGIRP